MTVRGHLQSPTVTYTDPCINWTASIASTLPPHGKKSSLFHIPYVKVVTNYQLILFVIISTSFSNYIHHSYITAPPEVKAHKEFTCLNKSSSLVHHHGLKPISV